MQVEYIILHHTGAWERDAEQVRRYHLSLGWRDVGYHFIIEPGGTVVVGRKHNTYGAHCRAAGMNRKSLGVALIGNFEQGKPTLQQYVKAIELVAWLRNKYAVPLENILEHRDVPGAKTLCPGRNFIPLVETLDSLDYRTNVW
ncbi:N-acetyl-anhydromuramyl-L-alanine amidase AmpD [Desulfitispora alkaliphila]|uniref:peptidoglycan recognition protein family protein n=1 Tax=Desulfitispora alkaliphila TaxID=622674 RepID=UPI003D1A39A4